MHKMGYQYMLEHVHGEWTDFFIKEEEREVLMKIERPGNSSNKKPKKIDLLEKAA